MAEWDLFNIAYCTLLLGGAGSLGYLGYTIYKVCKKSKNKREETQNQSKLEDSVQGGEK